MGYDRANAFRIYLPKSNEIVISCDVRFHENWTDVTFEAVEFHFDGLEGWEIEEGGDDYSQDVRNAAESSRNNGNILDIEDNSLLKDLTCYPNIIRTNRLNSGIITRNGFGFDTACLVTDSVYGGMENSVPYTYQEAMARDDSKNCHGAMKAEHDSLQSKGTWKLVPLPEGRKAIQTKWAHDVKRDTRGNIVSYKARLVAKGFSQKDSVVYLEIFSPVSRYSTTRLALALSVPFGWSRMSLDSKTAF